MSTGTEYAERFAQLAAESAAAAATVMKDGYFITAEASLAQAAGYVERARRELAEAKERTQ